MGKGEEGGGHPPNRKGRVWHPPNSKAHYLQIAQGGDRGDERRGVRRKRSQMRKRTQGRTDRKGKRRRRTAPIRGRGTPEEQVHSIVSNIINPPPGGGPLSGQDLAPHIQQVCTIGYRGAGFRDRSGGRGRGGGRGETGVRGSSPLTPQTERPSSRVPQGHREQGRDGGIVVRGGQR